MIRLRLETDLTVSEPNENEGLVVRWRAVVVRDHDDTVQEDVIGSVRATVIHYGEALDVGANLDDVMDGALVPLHDALFEDGWLKDDFGDNLGTALLFIEEVNLDEEWRERLVDLAVVRRLVETLGTGCSLAVLNGNEARRCHAWERIGFSLRREPGELFLVLNLSKRTPHLPAGFDRFEVVPTPAREVVDERLDERVGERGN